MVSGILFVHGIQGSPAQLRFLTERLPPCGHHRLSAEGKAHLTRRAQNENHL